MTHKVIIMQGLPASGKSTIAKAWAEEDPEHRIRINRDDIRNMLGKYWVPSRESLVSAIEDNCLYQAMNFGADIIIDNMNLNSSTVTKIRHQVEAFNNESDHDWLTYEVEIDKSCLATPLEVCIERDSKRSNPISEKVIRGIYTRYKEEYALPSNS